MQTAKVNKISPAHVDKQDAELKKTVSTDVITPQGIMKYAGCKGELNLHSCNYAIKWRVTDIEYEFIGYTLTANKITVRSSSELRRLILHAYPHSTMRDRMLIEAHVLSRICNKLEKIKNGEEQP